MQELLTMMARHGYALVATLLFAEAMGLPLPAAIALVGAGAAIASHTLFAPLVIASALLALVLGDAVQYWLGRYTGWALLGFLCGLSMNPETCILRSAESFYKRGKTTLIFAKFIPGVNTVAAPLAGSMNMPFAQFLQFEVAGASLYAMTYLLLGYLSRDFLASVLLGFHAAGRAMEIILFSAAIVYLTYRVMSYRKFKTNILVPRVQVSDLAERLSSGDAGRILIVDVRSHGYYDSGATRIKGSIRIEPNNLEEELKNLPKEKEIYLYCT